MSETRTVPIEPTDAMLRAGQKAWLKDAERKSSTLWRAMALAAPALTEASRSETGRGEGFTPGVIREFDDAEAALQQDPTEAQIERLSAAVKAVCREAKTFALTAQPAGEDALREALKRAEHALAHYSALAPDMGGGKQALDAVRAALANPTQPAAGQGAGDAERLRDVLRRFRDFVIERATQWDISRGPCNHHNPIWAEVAECLTPAPHSDTGEANRG